MRFPHPELPEGLRRVPGKRPKEGRWRTWVLLKETRGRRDGHHEKAAPSCAWPTLALRLEAGRTETIEMVSTSANSRYTQDLQRPGLKDVGLPCSRK